MLTYIFLALKNLDWDVNMSIDIQQPALEDIVDLEAYFAARRAVPHGKKYRIRIDKHHYTVHVHKMTGRQILRSEERRVGKECA